MKIYSILMSFIWVNMCFAAEMPHITTVHTGILPYTVRMVGNEFQVMLLLKSEAITLDDPMATRVLIWGDIGGEIGSADNKDIGAVDHFFSQTKGVLNCDGKKDATHCIAPQKKKMVEDMAYVNRMVDYYRQVGRTAILPISTQYYTIRLAKVDYVPAERLTQLLQGGYLWISADDLLRQMQSSYAENKDYKRIRIGTESLRRAFAYTILVNIKKLQAQIQELKDEAARTAYRLGFTTDPGAHPAVRSFEPGTDRPGRWESQIPSAEPKPEKAGPSSWENAKANVGMSWENTKTNLRVFFNWIKNYWGK